MTSGAVALEVDAAFLRDRDADMAFVVYSVETDAATQALERAIPRLLLVTFDGREFSDDDALWAEVRATNGEFAVTNASYVGDIERSGQSLSVYVDTDGAAPAAMGSTFARVIGEELTRAGVSYARLSPR